MTFKSSLGHLSVFRGSQATEKSLVQGVLPGDQIEKKWMIQLSS